MDFLRRLHPQHGMRADAALPDLSAWCLAGGPRAATEGVAATAERAEAVLASRRHASSGESDTEHGAAVRPSPVAPTPARHADPATVAPEAPGATLASRAPLAGIVPPRIEDRADNALRDRRESAPPASLLPAPVAAAVEHRAPAGPAGRPVGLAGFASPAADPGAARPLSRTGPVLRSPARALQSVGAAATLHPTRSPPVVHVSIDRIDVRIPGAPVPASAASATAARPRRAESSVGSLADYLRGRGRDRA